jgi:hypothetical protein
VILQKAEEKACSIASKKRSRTMGRFLGKEMLSSALVVYGLDSGQQWKNGECSTSNKSLDSNAISDRSDHKLKTHTEFKSQKHSSSLIISEHIIPNL